MSDVLKTIIADKTIEVTELKASPDSHSLAAKAADMPPARGFANALRKSSAQGYGLIAEFKRASPSRGLINPDAEPANIAQSYEAGGATCLSVLTDQKYFHGHINDMIAAKSATLMPVLRKDFMIDPIQIIESRAYGADCILLIMSALSDSHAAELEACAMEYGLDVLIETHDGEEIERALNLQSPMIGINNRNLRSMTTDLAVGEDLMTMIPDDRIAIAESGLKSSDDLARMARAGARCFLIGEFLMEQDDIATAVSSLLSYPLPVNWKDMA
ncbi:MAG: indole-3-glycerol phosphate synthase TrpC [Candidatus Puniceispirillales bacterium]